MKILVLNSGSSSQKTCLYEIGGTVPDDPPTCLWEGKIEWESGSAELSLKNTNGAERKERIRVASRDQAVAQLLNALWEGDVQIISGPSEIHVAGHRVVHGGPDHTNPALVTPEVKSAIAKVSAFAPLHNRAELEGMEVVEKLVGPVPQVAVFDTGFHSQMPPAAKMYPGPYEWFSDGIHRYGLHATRRPHDGHALGLGRPGHSHLPHAAERIVRRGARRDIEQAIRVIRNFWNLWRHAGDSGGD